MRGYCAPLTLLLAGLESSAFLSGPLLSCAKVRSGRVKSAPATATIAQEEFAKQQPQVIVGSLRFIQAVPSLNLPVGDSASTRIGPKRRTQANANRPQ